MNHAGPAPFESCGNQHASAIYRAGIFDVQVVRILVQVGPYKAIGRPQHLIGIDEEEVVSLAARQVERLGAVVPEIAPWTVVKFAWNSAKHRLHALRGVIERSGIDDHP